MADESTSFLCVSAKRETSFRGFVCHCFKSYGSLKPVRPIPNTTILTTSGTRRPMIEQRLVYPDTEGEESPKATEK